MALDRSPASNVIGECGTDRKTPFFKRGFRPSRGVTCAVDRAAPVELRASQPALRCCRCLSRSLADGDRRLGDDADWNRLTPEEQLTLRAETGHPPVGGATGGPTPLCRLCARESLLVPIPGGGRFTSAGRAGHTGIFSHDPSPKSDASRGPIGTPSWCQNRGVSYALASGREGAFSFPLPSPSGLANAPCSWRMKNLSRD